MVEKAVQWIRRYTIASQGIVRRSGDTMGSAAATGCLVPTLLEIGEPALARQYAVWLLSQQDSEGAFSDPRGRADVLMDTAQVVQGWSSVVDQLPELEQPLRKACEWLISRLTTDKNLLSPFCRSGEGQSGHAITLSAACLLPAIREAGKALGVQKYCDFVQLQMPDLLTRMQAGKFASANAMICGYAHSLEALLDCGEIDKAVAFVNEVDAKRQGDSRALGWTPWICSGCLAQATKVWMKLGQRDRALKALTLLNKLQNPSGGFFGAYGVGHAPDAARETVWALKQNLEAGMLCHGLASPRISSASPINPLFKERLETNSHRIEVTSSRNPRRVSLVVYFVGRNFGDVMLYETIQQRLLRAGLETETIEVSQPLRDSRLVEKANQSGFLVFVGGGLLEFHAPEIIRDFCHLQSALTTPYGVVGLSTGDFNYRHINPSLKAFAERAEFFYTRDEESIATFRSAGASKLPSAGVDMVFANESLAALKSEGNQIAANFRDVPYPFISGELDWQRWSKALREIGVEFLIPDSSPQQQQLGIPIQPGSELAGLRQCQVAVAMRFHIVLAAASMGVLPIPVTYCPKVNRLARQLGLEEFCLAVNEYSRLKEVFGKLQAQAQPLRHAMVQRVDQMRQCANDILEQTLDRIKKTCYA